LAQWEGDLRPPPEHSQLLKGMRARTEGDTERYTYL